MKPTPDGAGAQHLTPNERAAKGKAAREANPRAGHAAWSASQRTLRPMSLLLEQEETRVPELVPIRHGRMATSPFAYFRGAALPMAADLVTTSQSGLRVQLCGDAHLSNFGGFASPERELIFDVNDFDETAPGPFEWDVKRLAASLEVAGRALEFDDDARQKTVLRGVRTYREAMRRFAQMPRLDIWYAKLDIPTILALWGSDAGAGALKRLQRASGKAESKDHLKARDKLTGMKDGELRFLSDPPLLVPIEELYNRPDEAAQVEAVVHGALRSYRRTLSQGSPSATERVSLRRPGSKGRRRGQCGDTVLGGPLRWSRRVRSAHAPSEGGRSFRSRAILWKERRIQPRPAGGRGPASHAGRQ